MTLVGAPNIEDLFASSALRYSSESSKLETGSIKISRGPILRLCSSVSLIQLSVAIACSLAIVL